MRIFAVIPVKPLRDGKSRLGGVLDGAGRQALNRRFLDHTLAVAAKLPGLDCTIVVSHDAEVLDVARHLGADPVRENPGGGLNAALALARERVMRRGGDGMVVLPVDLPLLAAEDVGAVIDLAAPGPRMIISPNAAGTGTNLLLLVPPDALDFRFGRDSMRAHLAAARAAGVGASVLHRPNLGFDVDEPADYRRLRAVSV